MKMPGSVGTKKAKAVEQLLEELGVGECMHNNCVPRVLLSDKELIANLLTHYGIIFCRGGGGGEHTSPIYLR